MSYTAWYDPALHCIRVNITGEFDLAVLKKMALKVAELVAQHDCTLILNDLREAKITENTLNIYKMPTAAKNSGIRRQYRRALVVHEPSGDFQFIETVFRNRGNLVKLFTEFDAAVHWLLGE